MTKPTLSLESKTIIAIVNRVIGESRDYMNTCSDDAREALEADARAIMDSDGCAVEAQARKL